MRQQILQELSKYVVKHDWSQMTEIFKPNTYGRVGKDPVYEFFQTLDVGLEENPQPIVITVNPVNSYVPWHVHDYIDIITPLKGQTTIDFEHEQVVLDQGDLLIVGAYTPHQNQPIGDEDVVINITLKNNAFSITDLDFIRQNTSTSNLTNLLFFMPTEDVHSQPQYTVFRSRGEGKIAETIDDIVYEYFHSDGQSNQIIHSSLLILFARLIRLTQNSQPQVRTAAKTENTLLSLLLYIEKNYATITLEDMGEHFGFNPSYLSSYLKKHTGKSFIKLIHLQRVNVAANYLMYTKAPVEQIATKVGYENPSYFYKIFKKTVGLSPAEFREQK
ncbi:AraC family transcriptional regulator [Streptococcus caprae]|uniref:AraC family transcriptional regulator n=1 Tax=Streptococcus caprae TaxID=1640501 RepID=A0ABV8CX21_9STRE